MKAFRLGSVWQGRDFLLGLLLWSLWLTPSASQELVDPLRTPRNAVPETQRRIAASVRSTVQMIHEHGPVNAQTRVGSLLRVHATQAIDVYVYTTALTTATLDALRQAGAQVLQSDAASGIVYATVAPGNLERIAALPSVRWIGPAVHGVRRTGSVTSEGDAAMRAQLARTQLGLTGKGVRVGIISDSLTDLGTSVNSGDLPATLTIVNGQDGRTVSGANNEGQAMAEIIYDLAPGAQLLFRTGFPTSLDFIAAVQELTAAGANVIVDDLGFFNEPVFEDGPIAQAVSQAIKQGVVFVSAAGNDAQRHYQGVFQDFAPNATDPRMHIHNFGGGDTRLEVRIAPNALVVIFLQWPNPFDGSANTADYDLLLADAAGNTLAISNDNQINTKAPPLEAITFANTTRSTMTVGVIITRVAGPALPLSLNFNTFGRVTVVNHNVPSGSVFGHPCVRDVVAVGAVDANEADFNVLETFSSQGPCEIFFPSHEFRTKPDVAGADGVMTSLPDFTPFFGTSAAAPHVAAVAALLMEASGGPAASRSTRIANTLRLAAVDRGPTGVDNQFGYGVVDALLAAQAVQATANNPPGSIIDAPAADIVIAPNTTVTFQGTCVDVEGDQPFTFAWNFSGAASPSTVQNPGAIPFTTVGVFPITFTCTDATGQADPTPAMRRVTVNSPPDSRITSPEAGVTVNAGSSLNFAGTCSDPDGAGAFTFLWNFGGNVNPSTSTQANPTGVVFNTPGTFTVSFACTDALGSTDPTPALLQVVVNAVNTNQSSGGGGGGCTLVSSGTQSRLELLTTLGNLGLPVLLLGLMRLWQRTRRRGVRE